MNAPGFIPQSASFPHLWETARRSLSCWRAGPSASTLLCILQPCMHNPTLSTGTDKLL